MEKKLKEIKDAKPDEYSDSEDVKSFVNKYYDDILKASKTLEKDVSSMTKDEIMHIIKIVSAATLSNIIFIFLSPTIGLGAWFISFIAACVSNIIHWFKLYDDNRCAKELRKIKKGLTQTMNSKKIDEKTKEKIKKMINSINDAEAEYTSRMKVEESVQKYDIIFNVLQERVDNGEITAEYAESVNELAYDKYIMENNILNKIDKMDNKIRKDLYDKDGKILPSLIKTKEYYKYRIDVLEDDIKYLKRKRNDHRVWENKFFGEQSIEEGKQMEAEIECKEKQLKELKEEYNKKFK